VIIDRLFEAERCWPDKAAVIRGDSILSYRDLADRVRTSAHALRAHGVNPGDRVVLEASSTPEFVAAYLATHLAGAIAVPVSPKVQPGLLPQVVEMTLPAVVVGHRSKGWGPLTYDAIARQAHGADHELPHPVGKADPADLLFTTGTTARPKGVLLSHGAIETAAGYISDFLRQGDEDVEVVPLPLYHSFGLGRLRCCIYRGSTLVLVEGPTVFADAIRAMRQFRATGFASVPSGLAIIFRSLGDVLGEFSTQLRYLEIGSAAMPLADKRRLMALLPSTRLCMHYGLTEASRSAFIEFHESREALDSIGRPSPGVTIEVLDAEGAPAAAGSEGRIAIRSGAVMSGYWQDEEATRKAFSGDYLLTGDLGHRDEQGLFYLTGRESEFINIGGEKVAPGEMEALLMQHPEVADCACIGIPDPSGISGEVVKAILVASPESGARPSNQALAKHLRRQIQPYKMPRVFEWVDAIPRSESGKVLRNRLR
jgi:long-chain acyl-CoA synthetase